MFPPAASWVLSLIVFAVMKTAANISWSNGSDKFTGSELSPFFKSTGNTGSRCTWDKMVSLLWTSKRFTRYVNKTPWKIYSHWSGLSSKTFNIAFLIVECWCSTKPWYYGWYAYVTCCLVTAISSIGYQIIRSQISTWSFIYKLKHQYLQISSYRNWGTVGADLSRVGFASDHLEKLTNSDIQSTFGKE